MTVKRRPAGPGFGWRIVLIAIGGVALPAAIEAQLLTPRSDIVETLRTGRDVPVAGVDLVGAVALPANGTVNPERLRVFLPAVSQGSLCVDIRSRDGLYRARGEFAIDGVAAGPHALAWPTRYPGALRRYRAEDLAVLATAKGSCLKRDTTMTILVATWEADQRPPAVTLLFNLGDVDQAVFGTRDGRVRGSCLPLAASGGVAYNRKCTIALEGGRVHLLRLVGWHFESRSTLDFTLGVP